MNDGKGERWIELSPADWARAAWRHPEPARRGEARPFDLSQALDSLRKVTTENYGWEWHFEDAQIPAALSPEEAAFWLAAILSARSSITPRQLAAELKKGVPAVPTLPDVLWTLATSHWLSSEAMLPVSRLFPPEEIVEAILATHEKFLGSARASVNYAEAMRRILSGFARHVVPYLHAAERARLSAGVRPELDARNWPATGLSGRHTPASPAFYLGGLLGLTDDLHTLVETWPDDAYSGEGVYAVLHHRPQEIVLSLGGPELVELHMRRLKLLPQHREQVRAWLAHTEYSALDVVRDAVLAQSDRERAVGFLTELARVHAPEAAPYMLELMLGSRAPAVARKWLEENAIHAVPALIPVAAARGKLAESAAAYLRSAARKGGEPLIRSSLAGGAAEITDRIRTLVLEHPETTAPALSEAEFPAPLSAALAAPRKETFPDWVIPADLPPLLVAGRRLSDELTATLLSALSQSTLETPDPLVSTLKEIGDPSSLERFAWRLFETWLSEGAPHKERWALGAVGLCGGDVSALKLAPLARQWPGESQHQRAVFGLDCLRAIGTDTALMQIHAIAQKVQFKALKARAAECIEAIATARGLSRSELEDRIVPHCDLNERGRRTFDYGTRQFDFILGPDMKPMLRDTDGKLRPDLPKPGARDDARQCAEAAADWKLFKKQVAEVIKIQALRLEQAMVTGRSWPVSEFENLLVRHPLMTHLAQRLVWGTYDSPGKLLTPFRVAEDLTLVDIHDEPFSPSSGDRIRLVHPLHLTEEQRAEWRDPLDDYEIVPPFSQLGRPLFAPHREETETGAITRFAALKLPAPTLIYALDKQGWERGIPQDGGFIYSHTRPFPGAGVTAVVEYEPGVPIGYVLDGEDQSILRVYFVPGLRRPEEYPQFQHHLSPRDTDRVAISEVLADLTAIAARGK